MDELLRIILRCHIINHRLETSLKDSEYRGIMLQAQLLTCHTFKYERTFPWKDNSTKPVLKYEYISMVLKRRWLSRMWAEARPTSNFKQKTGFLWFVVSTETHACGEGYLGFFIVN